MTTFEKRAFLGQVIWQTDFLREAFERIDPARASRDWPKLWEAVQSLLVAAGNLGKLFDPILKKEPAALVIKASERSTILRDELRVADDSPLLDRRLRNHFEHFDMRIQEWASKTTRHDFVDGGVDSWS